MQSLERLAAHEVADQVRGGELSAVDVLEHHLQRIEEHAGLGAFVFVDADRARTVAKDVDRRVADPVAIPAQRTLLRP